MNTAVDAAGTTATDTDPAFTRLPDLASLPLGGGVVWGHRRAVRGRAGEPRSEHGGDG